MPCWLLADEDGAGCSMPCLLIPEGKPGSCIAAPTTLARRARSDAVTTVTTVTTATTTTTVTTTTTLECQPLTPNVCGKIAAELLVDHTECHTNSKEGCDNPQRYTFTYEFFVSMDECDTFENRAVLTRWNDDMEHVSATKKLLRPDVFDYDSTATSFPDASDIYANFMVHRTALVDHLTSLQPIDPDSKNNNNNNNGGNTGNGASSNGNPGNGTNSDDGVLPAQDKKKGGTVAAVVIVLLLLLLGGGGAYYYYYYIGRKRDAHEKSAAARNARKKKGHHGGHDFHDNPSFADNQDWSAESGTSANAETDDGELYTIYEELFGPTAKVGMSGAVGTSRATSNGSGTAGASIYGRVISDEGGDDYGDIDYSEHAIYSEGITFAELLKSAIDSTPPPLTSANPSTAFREAVTRAAKTCGDQNMDAKLIIDCIEYSVKFGEKVHRKQVQSGTLPHQSLTAMDIAVIHSYTLQTALYGALNKALREFAEDADYDIDDFLPYIALLIAALEKLPPLQTVVYRGIRKPAADLLGTKGDNDRFTFPAFTSTTLSPHVLMQPDFLGVDRRLGTFALLDFFVFLFETRRHTDGDGWCSHHHIHCFATAPPLMALMDRGYTP